MVGDPGLEGSGNVGELRRIIGRMDEVLGRSYDCENRLSSLAERIMGASMEGNDPSPDIEEESPLGDLSALDRRIDYAIGCLVRLENIALRLSHL